MSKPRLTYFDAPASRGEECRLALHLAGVPFEDVRIKRDAWAALKPTTPYGSMPLLDLPGKPTLAHSNAILGYIGRTYDLHPTDAVEAARHEGLMEYVEDLRHKLSPTIRMEAPERQRVREQLAAEYLPTWGANVERQLGDGPFVAGAKLHVVDIKLYIVVRWLTSGIVDHIPATIFDAYPKLMRVHDAVRDHAGVKAWYARS